MTKHKTHRHIIASFGGFKSKAKEGQSREEADQHLANEAGKAFVGSTAEEISTEYPEFERAPY